MIQINFSGDLNSVRTLANARFINFNDKKAFKKYINENLNLHTESYKVSPVIKITFTYRVMEGNATADKKLQLINSKIKQQTNNRIISRKNLPLSMDPFAFGQLISKTIFNGFIRFVLNNQDQTIVIDSYNNGERNECRILGSSQLM